LTQRRSTAARRRSAAFAYGSSTSIGIRKVGSADGGSGTGSGYAMIQPGCEGLGLYGGGTIQREPSLAAPAGTPPGADGGGWSKVWNGAPMTTAGAGGGGGAIPAGACTWREGGPREIGARVNRRRSAGITAPPALGARASRT
jgi:hypothetical protein